MDTKKLRQKILDLAIRGKLVPQDPNDEPASVLLERIKAEKERLTKEGKIKKGKKSEKTSDTPHYEQVLPNGWCLSTLGEVFTLQAGKNITAKDIKDTATELNPYKCYGGNGVRGFVASYNREGDFPIIGRQGALCGNINIAKGKFYATEHAVVVERYCDVDLMWAYYTLTTLNLNQYATATAQPGLSVAVINDVYIPIPPQKEQERISQEIEHWFALIEQIEQGKADLQTTIKQTKNRILDLAIHGKLVPQDPNDEPAIELLKRINHGFTPCDNEHYTKLPNKWCYCSFKDVFIDITSKPYQILQSQIKDSGKYPVISQSANFIEGYSDENNVFQHKRACIIFGDHTRNVKYIDFDFIVGADGVKILCPKVNEKWAYYSILYASSHIEKKGYSRHFGQIVQFSMILPPFAEQYRIVKKIEELFSVLDNIKNALEV